MKYYAPDRSPGDKIHNSMGAPSHWDPLEF